MSNTSGQQTPTPSDSATPPADPAPIEADSAPEQPTRRAGTVSLRSLFSANWFGLGLPTDPIQRIAVVLGSLIVCVMVVYSRWKVVPYTTYDASHFVIGWFNWIKQHGFDFSERFSDYNVPYLYLLWFASKITGNGLLAIKLVSNVGDVVLAWGVYRIVSHFTGPRMALVAAFTIMVIPTTWLNSAVWGQTDQLYAALAAHSVAFLLRDKQRLAWLFFGFALAFKLQAIFVLPFLMVIWLRAPKRNWGAPAVGIIGWFSGFIPAMLAGSNLRTLLLTYTEQTASGRTTISANIWQLFSLGDKDFQAVLVPFTAAIIGGLLVTALVKDGWFLDKGKWLSLAALICLVLPYLLPGMRNRYFFMAEMFALVVAFARPRMWWVAALAAINGAYGYSVSLFYHKPPFSVEFSALPYFIVMLGLLRDVFDLRSRETTVRPDDADADESPTEPKLSPAGAG